MVNAVAIMKTLLSDNWIYANTDNNTPLFINSKSDVDANRAKRFGSRVTDTIRIYENSPEERNSSGIGAKRTSYKAHVSLDITSGKTELKAERVKQEVLRILETKLASPGTGFDYIDPDYTIQPFSGTKNYNNWRWVVDVIMVKTNATLGA